MGSGACVSVPFKLGKHHIVYIELQIVSLRPSKGPHPLHNIIIGVCWNSIYSTISTPQGGYCTDTETTCTQHEPSRVSPSSEESCAEATAAQGAYVHLLQTPDRKRKHTTAVMHEQALVHMCTTRMYHLMQLHFRG